MTKLKCSNNRIASALNRFGLVFGGNIINVQGGILRQGMFKPLQLEGEEKH